MNKTQWTWLIWAIVSIGGFFVLEFQAIFDNDPETSALTNVVVWNIPWWIFMPILVSVCSWVVPHFWKYYKQRYKK